MKEPNLYKDQVTEKKGVSLPAPALLAPSTKFAKLYQTNRWSTTPETRWQVFLEKVCFHLEVKTMLNLMLTSP